LFILLIYIVFANRGMIEWLKLTPLSWNQKEAVETMQIANMHLSNTIADVLQMSVIESGI
jgi:hypothetical protein